MSISATHVAHDRAHVREVDVDQPGDGDTVIATGFASRDARRIERTDATRVVGTPDSGWSARPPQGSLALRQVTEPAPAIRAARTPEPQRHTPSPGVASAKATPPPARRAPSDKPVRHISWDELRQITGATEDELELSCATGNSLSSKNLAARRRRHSLRRIRRR